MFLTKMKRDGYASSSIRATKCSLAVFYSALIDCKLVHENIFQTVNIKISGEQVRPTQALTEVEVVAILRAVQCEPMSLALLSVLFGAGLRINEALSLKVSDCMTRQGNSDVLRLHHTKTTALRYVAISDWVSEALFAHLEASPDAVMVFPISYHKAKRLFQRALTKAGISGRYTCHSARATAITTLLDHGISHRDVQLFSGHSKISMVEQYDKRRVELKYNPGLKLVYGGLNGNS